ncbi:hypothetical protein CORC01_01578 [Colletotrichum orchidophilum]|uniref:Uncharacterized protein n=1 Tax=Colletotrichum orchidophilum TaxID=1209926 RepID=A0A1G4BP44_9PEZI|nr:uncharacterized protein CORC01_01578 [Colletotrichum orchidophilum]OHF03194.1 hypothetical protein CORC01_01578 [Colletotrichum orchidophilum]
MEYLLLPATFIVAHAEQLLVNATEITGCIDINLFEVGLTISIASINIGNIFGNLKDGVTLKVNLLSAKGEIRVYLKNGNKVWVHLDV